MTEINVAVLVGSLRAESIHLGLARIVAEEAPPGVNVSIVDELAEVPFYNEDIDADTAPPPAVALRERIAAADRVLVVTPEYNGTMPAVINNAIDWLSRPYGAGAIVDKPLAVVGASASRYGAKWSHADTARSAGIAGAVVVEDAIVSQPAADIDVMTDPDVRAKLRTALTSLVQFEPAPAAGSTAAGQ